MHRVATQVHFFFFQAEDGIRDGTVTGVQTCALPIFAGHAARHAGSRYTSVRFTETLMLAGLAGSIGTVGDAYDNALAETTIGLYKSECVRDGSPFRDGPLATLAQVEKITSAWVHWYNNDRLMHRTGLRPPA